MSIYKSVEGARAIRERYIRWLERWPVPSRHLRVPTREGETFVLACGPEDAPPLVLLHGSHGNAVSWIADAPLWSQRFRTFAVDVIGQPGLSAETRPPLGSDAYALWLDDVLLGLGITNVAIVGESLGGWLAVDYATRHPKRVTSLALLVPGGVGRQKNILLKALPLMLLGSWGARKLRRMVFGSASAQPSSKHAEFSEFIALIFTHFEPSKQKLPVFSDKELQRLTMPTLAIVGAHDIMLDSADTKRRLENNLPHVEVQLLKEAGHVILNRSAPILEFLASRAQSELR